MVDNLQLRPGAITQTYASIAITNVITLKDRRVLRAAALNETLEPEERNQIDRILYSVRRGWVKVDA